LCTAVTKATGYINQEKIRIHNYAKIQHMLKNTGIHLYTDIQVYIVYTVYKCTQILHVTKK